MGENQSKPATSNQKPLLGFMNKNSPPKKTSHSLSSSPSGYSPAQQEQLSPEEVRRRRLAKMEKEEYVPERGLPKDIKSHPISLEFGANAYLIHMNLEDLYLNTFHSSSLSRNPRLRLLQPKDPSEEIRLYTLENMDKTIMAFLQSETYFPGGERLVFLSDLYGRLLSSDQSGLISPEKSQELQKKLVTCLMDYLLNPSACSPGMPTEDLRVISDCSCPIYDALYTKLSAVDTDGFFYKFIGLVPEEHYDAILTPIFKRMIRDSSQNTLSGRFDIQKAIALLSDLLQCDIKIAEFFFNHELFLPKTSKPTGLDFQKNTVFGSFLSFTIMNNETPSMHEALITKEMIRNLESSKQALREKIHDPLNSFHRLIEGMIKLNPKYKKNILDWFYGALVANKSINGYFSGPNSKLVTFGWLTNFLVLLLKLCQKMLEDPKAYPNWLTKINLSYIYERPIFEGLNLINGKTIPKKDPTQESKYTFLTELIFMTSHAWFLAKEAFVSLFEATGRVIVIYQQVDRNFTPDSLSKEDLQALKIFVAGRTQLVDPYLTRQLHNLLNFQALLILHSYGAQVQDINDLPSIFEQCLNKEEGDNSQQGGVLNYWTDNIWSYFEKYLVGIEAAAFAEGYDHLELLMNFSLWIVANKKWSDTPLLFKLKAIDTLHKLLPRKRTSGDEANFAFLFKDNIYYEKHLVDGLVDSFLQMKALHMSFEPFVPQRQRGFVLKIFNYLLQDVFATEASTCYVIKGLDKLFKNSTESYFEFMDTFIDDIVLVLDGISSRLQNKSQSLNTPAQNAYLAQKTDDSLNSLLTSIGEYISFAMNLSKNYPEFVVNDLVRERFATSLNYCMKILNQEGMLDVKVMNTYGQESSLRPVLINLVKAYLNLSGNQEFMNNVKSDEKNYNSYYFNKTHVFCEENSNLLTGIEKEQLSQLIASLE